MSTDKLQRFQSFRTNNNEIKSRRLKLLKSRRRSFGSVDNIRENKIDVIKSDFAETLNKWKHLETDQVTFMEKRKSSSFDNIVSDLNSESGRTSPAAPTSPNIIGRVSKSFLNELEKRLTFRRSEGSEVEVRSHDRHQRPKTLAVVAAISIIKQGPLERVKIASSTHQLPKHWSRRTYACIAADGRLCLGEDSAAVVRAASTPSLIPSSSVHVLQIKECRVSRGTSHSSKKNVIELTTDGVDGNGTGKMIALLQCESSNCESWLEALNSVSPSRTIAVLARSTLTKFLSGGARPTRDSLEERGIYRDESVFGSRLTSGPAPPRFVVECAKILGQPPHVTSAGLYRTSGNLSHIQKLRLRIDQGDFDVLNTIKDTDVLAGALKLYFRELREPLLPYSACQPLLESIASSQNIVPNKKTIMTIQTVLRSHLPESHLKTLSFLCNHLAQVCRYEHDNHMSPYSMGIVWGPSSTWPADGDDPQAVMLNCTTINQVLEYLITNEIIIFNNTDKF